MEIVDLTEQRKQQLELQVATVAEISKTTVAEISKTG